MVTLNHFQGSNMLIDDADEELGLLDEQLNVVSSHNIENDMDDENFLSTLFERGDDNGDESDDRDIFLGQGGGVSKSVGIVKRRRGRPPKRKTGAGNKVFSRSCT
jgi:hypothetical protein